MNVFLLILAAVAIAATQMLAGGRQFAYCLPGYLLLAGAALFSAWPGRKPRIATGTWECLFTAALAFLYLAGRALLAADAFVARNDLFLAIAAVTLYLLIALQLTSSRLRLWMFAVLLLLAFGNGVIAAFQFFESQNFMPFPALPRANYGSRASGFYGYPNHLAGFLEVVILLSVSVAFWSRQTPSIRVLVGYVALMSLGALLTSGSRGGYISVTVGLFVFALLSLRQLGRLASPRALTLLGAGILAAAVLAFVARHAIASSYEIQQRASAVFDLENGRMQFWQAAWRQFKVQPIFGTGSGTHLYYGRQFREPTMQLDVLHAHNDYLELLAEYGVLGLIVVIIFVETHLRHGWRTIAAIGAQRFRGIGSNSLALTMGAFSGVIAALVHCGVDFNLHSPPNVLVVAFLLGILAHPATAPEERAPSADAARDFSRYARLALPALGLWAALRLAPMLPAQYYAEQARLASADYRYVLEPQFSEAAIAHAQKGLQWDAGNSELHLHLGQAQFTRATLSTDPAEGAAWNQQAAETFTKAVALSPRDVRLVLGQATALTAAGRLEEAEPAFERAVELDPFAAHVRYQYGLHLHRAGKLAAAAEQFQRALDFGGEGPARASLTQVTEELKAAQPTK